jgi:uncharacterized membrane protein YhiD involved in acid resistance
MFEIFPDGPVYEYPQLINVTYSFLWAFLLSSLIAITHRLTFTGDNYPKNFFQALILGSVVTTMVMMAIGDSLARGLGVFGAMAIIRFSTRIDNPRDVLFIFAALSTGLAIGVYGFTVSFAGTAIFCLIAFFLHISPFKTYLHQHRISFTLPDSTQLPKVMELISRSCYEYRQMNIQLTKENIMRYDYSVSIKKEITTDHLMEQLKSVEGIQQLRLTTFDSLNPQ